MNALNGDILQGLYTCILLDKLYTFKRFSKSGVIRCRLNTRFLPVVTFLESVNDEMILTKLKK